MTQDWRQAKMPKWAKEAIEKEMHGDKLRAALAWPTVAEPEPMPFGWGDYGRAYGNPEPGVFWFFTPQQHYLSAGVHSISVRCEKPSLASKWEFAVDGGEWKGVKPRARLYKTRADAEAALRWHECRKAAETLLQVDSAIRKRRS